MLAAMTRVGLLVLVACSSSSKDPPPAPAPAPAPPAPVTAERPPPDAPESESLMTSFYVLGASTDDAHVLIANVYAPARDEVIELRVLSATTGALEKTLALPELTRLPGLMHDDKLEAALTGNTALVAELRAAADLLIDYPGAVGTPIVTSADRTVIAAHRDLRWFLVQGATAILLPKNLDTPWIAPDGKTILYINPDGIYALELATGVRTKRADATHVTSIERWRVSADHAYVRIPYGGTEPCVVELPLAAAPARPPQCFGTKEPAPIMAISDNGTWLAMQTITRTGKKRVRIVDLDRRAKVFDNAMLDLGGEDDDVNLVVGPSGRAYALHASHAYALDAPGRIYELPHDEEQTSCIVLRHRLACLAGTKLVLSAPRP